MAIKPLRLADLEGDSQFAPLWALNSAEDSELGLAGELILMIPKLNGSDKDRLKLPQTWLPIDLTTQVPRPQLLASSELRSAVDKELITLISDKDAQRLLSRPGAKEEKSRLQAERMHQRAAGAARTIADTPVEIRNDSEIQDKVQANAYTPDGHSTINVAEAALGGVEEVEPGIKPSFKMFADRLQTESDLAALNAIRNRKRFTKKELQYLSSVLKGKTKSLAMVQKHLSK